MQKTALLYDIWYKLFWSQKIPFGKHQIAENGKINYWKNNSVELWLVEIFFNTNFSISASFFPLFDLIIEKKKQPQIYICFLKLLNVTRCYIKSTEFGWMYVIPYIRFF